MYFRQSWNDPRLQFQDSEIPKISVPGGWKKFWVPDSFFRYDLGSFVHDVTVPNRLLSLSNNGDIWYVIK